MATPIEMPKLGNTVEECLLAKWHKHTGDPVAEGELIAEIETDKATFELTAPVGGTLLDIFFSEGELIPVFTNVCVVGAPGESVDAFRPRVESKESKPASPQIPAATSPMGQKLPSVTDLILPRQQEQGSIQAAFSPRAKRFAQEHHFFPEHIQGTGPGGRIMEADIKRLYYELPRQSSLAKKFMENGCELRGEGSGTGGMVLSGDLTPAPAKMSTIRERIARRMRESLATTAQYTMNTSAVATGLLSLRNQIKAQGRKENLPDININEMVMFCVVKALEAVPQINVELIDGKVYQHSSIHIAFACDTPKGLIVPVVKDSQKLTLPELAARVKALARQAIEGSIAPDDLSGGTFTVSNLGIYGVESFSPVLNPPQVAILGVNAIELKPIRRNGAVEFIDHIGLSLTCDHQVIDGAPGARFLKEIKERIEGIETFVQF
jgi:pyruvate dehydrogenase E2 component (dihydrolipoamide acetyltransferase)